MTFIIEFIDICFLIRGLICLTFNQPSVFRVKGVYIYNLLNLQMNTALTSSTRDYSELINPLLAQQLELLLLDKVYHRGAGAYLYYLDVGGEERRVTDFVGGYGAALLGHAPRELTDCAIRYLEKERPGLVQLSVKDEAVRCARWLQEEVKALTGRTYNIIFANSGAEAVEAGLKHARLVFYEKINDFFRKFEQETARVLHVAARQEEGLRGEMAEKIAEIRRQNAVIIEEATPIVLAARNAFHGKTAGALSVTWNPEYRDPFFPGQSSAEFVRLEVAEIERVFQANQFHLHLPSMDHTGRLFFRAVPFNRISAALIEPIQGEGGVQPVPTAFIQRLAEASRAHAVPLIVDEIQTGCYRAGHLLLSVEKGVVADYFVLGKALGGGLAKISALLVDRRQYRSPFGLLHSSTFAEDGWSCHLALQALEQLKTRASEVIEKGTRLIRSLRELQRLYPAVVRAVRGEGLMIGIEFRDFSESNSYCFQIMARSGRLHYLYAGYLLNEWGLRVAAPLSAANVLRIQPPVAVSEVDVQHLMRGLHALCEIIDCEDFYKLIEFRLPAIARGLRDQPQRFYHGNIPREPAAPGARKVGFLTHFIDTGTVKAGDPSLRLLEDPYIEELLESILPLSTPTILGSKNIKNRKGAPVHITLAGLSFTSSMCRRALSDQATEPFVRLCQQAVRMLKTEGAELIGLGQYTSILTQNGLNIPETEVGLTTGNSFTVQLGLETVRARLREQGRELSKVKVGIIGAGGNIASVFADLFADDSAGVLLLGNSGRKEGYLKAVRTARNIYQRTVGDLLQGKGQHGGNLGRWLANSAVFREIRNGDRQAADPRLYEAIEKEFGKGLLVRAVRSIVELKECQVIIVATSADRPFLFPEHFHPHTLILDLSVPHNCRPELIQNNKDIEVILGGIARLPNGETLPVKGFPLEAGQVYGCMAETLLLGLEGRLASFSLGRIDRQQVALTKAMAREHGFEPAAAGCLQDVELPSGPD